MQRFGEGVIYQGEPVGSRSYEDKSWCIYKKLKDRGSLKEAHWGRERSVPYISSYSSLSRDEDSLM